MQVISNSRLKKFVDYDKEVISEMMKNYKSWIDTWSVKIDHMNEQKEKWASDERKLSHEVTEE